MWEEDISDEFEPDREQPREDRAPGEHDVPSPSGQFPQFPQAVRLPHLVPVMDLYEAARARAIADQQLSKLFNPEYYI